jgi:hypothetical protein
MKTAAIAIVLSILPQAAALATEVDVGVEVRSGDSRVAVAASHGAPVWEPARWENHGGRWVQRPGYWRQVAAPAQAEPVVYREPAPEQVVYAEVAPPPEIVEVRPAPPHPHAVWVPGYWRWDRHRHVWMAGRWATPQPGYVWVSPRWYRHGHRWAWAAGSWRRGGHDHRDRGGYRHDRRHQGRGHHHGRR